MEIMLQSIYKGLVVFVMKLEKHYKSKTTTKQIMFDSLVEGTSSQLVES